MNFQKKKVHKTKKNILKKEIEQTEESEKKDKKNDKEKDNENKSFVDITLQRPVIHLTTTAINSLFLFFSDDPDSQNKKSMNVNRKTLLKCILKYGNIRKLVDQKKRKKRFFIFF